MYSREKTTVVETSSSSYEDSLPWSPINPAKTTSAYYQVTGGDADWSGFDPATAGSGKCDPLPDRKYSVPVYNAHEAAVKLRDRKDNVPSRPSSLIESSEQKDLKVFEIGNLGDNSRLNNMLNSNSTSQVKAYDTLLIIEMLIFKICDADPEPWIRIRIITVRSRTFTVNVHKPAMAKN